MTEAFKKKLLSKHQDCFDCPSNEDINVLFEDIMSLLFPNFSDHRLANNILIDERIKSLRTRLEHLFLHHPSLCSSDPKLVAEKFISLLEIVENKIQLDLNAIFDGDPAAKSKEEIVRSYPGFFAISAYRIANQLNELGVKVVPRIITEHAHHKTGIDIHPSSTIGQSFCIDHGTGVVIGETAVIGDHVKLYQGVTLGALSVDKVDADLKRHPTLESHVVVYANATILGGETIIGRNSVIGGNSWITKSVDPFSTVYYVVGDNQVEKQKI